MPRHHPLASDTPPTHDIQVGWEDDELENKDAEGTEEEGFVARRTAHVRARHGDALTVREVRETPEVGEADRRPMRRLSTLVVPKAAARSRVGIVKRRVGW